MMLHKFRIALAVAMLAMASPASACVWTTVYSTGGSEVEAILFDCF
jgi:hypothetical protein